MTNSKLILSSLELSDSLLACSEDCGEYSTHDALRFQVVFSHIFCSIFPYLFHLSHWEPRVVVPRRNVNDIRKQNLVYEISDNSQILEMLRGLLKYIACNPKHQCKLRHHFVPLLLRSDLNHSKFCPSENLIATGRRNSQQGNINSPGNAWDVIHPWCLS